MDFEKLLRESVAQKASDIFLKANFPPAVRINGRIVHTNMDPLTPEEVQNHAYDLMNENQKSRFQNRHELDLAFTMEGVARFRVNIYQERSNFGIVLRIVPLKIASLEELGLPTKLAEMVMGREGLVLVTGPTGSGKSSTLAAMIDVINQTRRVNILTVEDPIEFMHTDKKGIVSQREVGVDTASFNDALKYVVRESADVLLIGEIRDADAMAVALQASGTGHLVLSTVHTAGAAESVDRIVNMFPPTDKDQICYRLARALRGVVSQKLVPKADNSGRVAALEIMVNNPTISKLMEEGHIGRLYSTIAEGAFWGMQTMNQSISKFVMQGIVTEEDAMDMSNNPVELKQLLRKRENNLKS